MTRFISALFSAVRPLGFALCSALAFTSASDAATFQFSGRVEGATLAGFSPNSLADLTFAFEVDFDETFRGAIPNIPLTRFSGLTVNETVFDLSNTTGHVFASSNFITVFVGGTVNAAAGIRPNTDDFLVNFFRSNSDTELTGLQEALLPDNTLSLVRVNLSNSDRSVNVAGTSISGTARVTQLDVAPVPVPPALALSATAILGLWGLRRRRSGAAHKTA